MAALALLAPGEQTYSKPLAVAELATINVILRLVSNPWFVRAHGEKL